MLEKIEQVKYWIRDHKKWFILGSVALAGLAAWAAGEMGLWELIQEIYKAV